LDSISALPELIFFRVRGRYMRTKPLIPVIIGVLIGGALAGAAAAAGGKKK
jgi:hypothetical protein